MKTNIILRICGVICLLSGIVIAALAFKDTESSTYSKFIGPLQIVVGLLFLIISRQKKSE